MGEVMTFVAKVLLALLLSSLLGAGIIIQHKELMAEREKNATLRKDNAQRDATIQQLQEAEADNK